MSVKGKSIIVTGGAQGIGFGISKRLAKEGAQVAIADLNGEKAKKAAEAIKAEGGDVIAVEVNVMDRAQVKNMIDETVKAFGKLDVIFNNAGYNVPQRFLEITEDNFNAVCGVNTLGTLICMQEAAKQMIKQGHGGKIVNTASISSYSGEADFTPYCVSKFGVHALIQGGAKALTPEYGITVNGFGPGVVATPLWDQLDKDLMTIGASEKTGQAFEAFCSGILQGRAATPEDIAGAAYFLASTDSDYMTGQILMIDGGMVFV